MSVRLRTKLKLMKPSALVKIGCKEGTRYLYAGTVAGFVKEYTKIEKERKAEAERKQERAFEALQNETRKHPKTADYWANILQDWSKYRRMVDTADRAYRMVNDRELMERPIIDTFPSECPWDAGCTVLLVSGYDDGSARYDDCGNMKPLKDIDDAGAISQFGAIWREPADFLTDQYYKRLKATGSLDEYECGHGLAYIHKTEHELHESIVATCKEVALRQYEEWKKEHKDKAWRRKNGIFIK